jgi:hypothetical protein
MVHDESGHMADASGPWFSRAGPGPRAQDERVCLETRGGGDDFLLRAALDCKVRDRGAGDGRHEALVPNGQERGPSLIVGVRQTLLYRGSLRHRPRSSADYGIERSELPRSGFRDMEKRDFDL